MCGRVASGEGSQRGVYCQGRREIEVCGSRDQEGGE